MSWAHRASSADTVVDRRIMTGPPSALSSTQRAKPKPASVPAASTTSADPASSTPILPCTARSKWANALTRSSAPKRSTSPIRRSLATRRTTSPACVPAMVRSAAACSKSRAWRVRAVTASCSARSVLACGLASSLYFVFVMKPDPRAKALWDPVFVVPCEHRDWRDVVTNMAL